MTTRMPQSIVLMLRGEPQSIKNRRRIVRIGRGRRRRLASIKSASAMAYTESIRAQATEQMAIYRYSQLQGRLAIHATLYYRTERPDLDGEAICDALQGICYANDRQLRRKHWDHAIDRQNPRAELVITPTENTE